MALNFARFDFDIAKNLLDKALKIIEKGESKASNEVVVSIIYNNYTALYNRYKKYHEAIECKTYSVDFVRKNLESKFC